MDDVVVTSAVIVTLYSVQVSQEILLQYIHFNRLNNRMLIDQLKKEIGAHHPTPVSTAFPPAATTPVSTTPASTTTGSTSPVSTSPASTSPASTSTGSVKILVRKEVGNPADYFDKTFAEYQEGFSSNGSLNQQLTDNINHL